MFLRSGLITQCTLCLFNSPEVLSSASDRAKLLAKNFSKNYNLDDSGIFFLPVFPSRANLKLDNISVTPKMVKKVIINLDSSKGLVLTVFLVTLNFHIY